MSLPHPKVCSANHSFFKKDELPAEKLEAEGCGLLNLEVYASEFVSVAITASRAHLWNLGMGAAAFCH